MRPPGPSLAALATDSTGLPRMRPRADLVSTICTSGGVSHTKVAGRRQSIGWCAGLLAGGARQEALLPAGLGIGRGCAR